MSGPEPVCHARARENALGLPHVGREQSPPYDTLTQNARCLSVAPREGAKKELSWERGRAQTTAARLQGRSILRGHSIDVIDYESLPAPSSVPVSSQVDRGVPAEWLGRLGRDRAPSPGQRPKHLRSRAPEPSPPSFDCGLRHFRFWAPERACSPWHSSDVHHFMAVPSSIPSPSKTQSQDFENR